MSSQENKTIILDVPYEKRTEVKEQGAKWNPKERYWYVKQENMNEQLKGFVRVIEPHEVVLEDFLKSARVDKLEKHPRAFLVTHGEHFRAFSDEKTPIDALKDVHRACINNVLYMHQEQEPGRPLPRLPNPEVLNDYPHYQEAFANLYPAQYRQEQMSHLPAFVLDFPKEKLEYARSKGAYYDRELGAYCAPQGKQEQLEEFRFSPKPVFTTEGMTPQEAFSKALAEAGVRCEQPIMDGKLHRAPLSHLPDTNRDGAYVGYLEGFAYAGYIQNFVAGTKQTWKMKMAPSNDKPAPYYLKQLNAYSRLQQFQRNEERIQNQNKARLLAQTIWESAMVVKDKSEHHYLATKNVNPYGVRIAKSGDLIIPAYDENREIHTVQFISSYFDQDKRFLKHGKKTGNFHVIGNLTSGCDYLVAEGYATSASLHEATGLPVVCAFDSGNIKAVIETLQVRYPSNFFCICYDDDQYSKVNVGFIKASAAANELGGGIICPEFRDRSQKPTDFNDMAKEAGLESMGSYVSDRFKIEKHLHREFVDKYLTSEYPGFKTSYASNDSQYAGKIVLKLPGFLIQESKSKHLYIHDSTNLDRQPRLNADVNIQYRNGMAQVSPIINKEYSPAL